MTPYLGMGSVISAMRGSRCRLRKTRKLEATAYDDGRGARGEGCHGSSRPSSLIGFIGSAQ